MFIQKNYIPKPFNYGYMFGDKVSPHGNNLASSE
jgi:hypothetical protein